MSLTFSKAERIAGFSPALFRKALRAYAGRMDPGRLICAALFRDAPQGAIVYEEALARGMILPPGQESAETSTGRRGITCAGVAVLQSTSSRTPKEKAQKHLADFLDRIDVLNASLSATRRVEEVWIFGSMLREVETVGDIDLAVSFSCGMPELEGAARQEEVLRQFRARRGPSKFIGSMIGMEEWMVSDAAFGGRMPTIFSGFHHGHDDLIALGVPCQLVYARARGGCVADPVLPRHPKSRGRKRGTPPVVTKDTLRPTPLQPMDARWITGYDGREVICPHRLFRTNRALVRSLFPVNDLDVDMQVITDKETSRSREGECCGDEHHGGNAIHAGYPRDGRRMVGLAIKDQVSTSAVEMERSIVTGPAPALNVTFHHPKASLGPVMNANMAGLIATLLLADAERLVRRQMESASFSPVAIQIALAEGDQENLTGRILANIVASLLRQHIGKVRENIEADTRATSVPEISVSIL